MKDSLEISEIMHFHSGKMSDMSISTKQNISVTVGEDGIVKLWDYFKDKEYYSRRFDGKGTALDFMPHSEAS